ncbi:acyltransferase family protein [Neolewinella persica]|uniref:acyltransferase family protein n=1 Tax=Neolewinella persica TaxID=70998 RepID=UPI00035C9F32|nr:heparan-alpha-glucosaminide N-acetyltransferase domain-containing protein [Neolewinella persica]
MLNQRIESVDILRGITIAAMMLVNNPGSWGSVYDPLLHADWHGYTPTDLVFPFFLFIVGCSIAFAYRGKKATGKTYQKISIRALKLIGLGIFLGAFTLTFPFFKEWESIRLPGVLQRIGLAFFFAAIIALNANWKVIIGVTAALLLGYWGIMGFLPLPDGSAPTYERAANNWAMYFDKAILGSHTWKPDYDPEGLLSTLPSIATALLGVLAGRLLISSRADKLIILGIGGIVLLIAGHLWGLTFPINKALWTSSFVLVTAGWACISLWVISYFKDFRNARFGDIFKRVGANALILYFLSSFIAKIFGMTGLHEWLYEHLYVHDFIPAKLSSLLYGLSVAGFYVLLGLFLWKRKIFIKV